MELEVKVVLGTLATIVALVNYLPYLIGVVRQTLHPHAFSWIIFTIITATVSAAQFSAGAGAGAWATAATALTTFLIAGFALRNRGYRITGFDTASLIGALIAIPAWVVSDNPLLAVVILTCVEALGFLPTYRKAWLHPRDESRLAFSLTILKYTLALGAMQIYSLTTILFPVALIVFSTLLIVETSWRRRTRL